MYFEGPLHNAKVMDLETRRVSTEVVLTGPPHPHKEVGKQSDNIFIWCGDKNTIYKVYIDINSNGKTKMVTDIKFKRPVAKVYSSWK